MHPYLPHTDNDKKTMLEKCQLTTMEELFGDIPQELLYGKPLSIPQGLSEMETLKVLQELSEKNMKSTDYISFLGAGAYEHYIPTTISAILSRSEFYTAYTPYQPEVSQGTLQAIFEYQSMICQLTDMDVSNASLYDGATAAAEAMFMACAIARKDKVLVDENMHPMHKKVIMTYGYFKDIEVKEISLGDVDEELNKKEYACVIVQNPNFYGEIDDLTKLSEKCHGVKALLIASVDPISLGLYQTPGQQGVDLVVGEAQSLGLSLSFGGPYLGFIACRKKHMRKLPGRIVGETVDSNGNRAFVLTLQAREQHIRREKATSNITSNQALMALGATVYLATMGKEGLRDVATQSFKKAHYLYECIKDLKHVDSVTSRDFFKEFVVTFDSSVDEEEIYNNLLGKGFLPGLRLSDTRTNSWLLCATEMRSKQDILSFIKALEVELCKEQS